MSGHICACCGSAVAAPKVGDTLFHLAEIESLPGDSIVVSSGKYSGNEVYRKDCRFRAGLPSHQDWYQPGVEGSVHPALPVTVLRVGA